MGGHRRASPPGDARQLDVARLLEVPADVMTLLLMGAGAAVIVGIGAFWLAAAIHTRTGQRGDLGITDRTQRAVRWNRRAVLTTLGGIIVLGVVLVLGLLHTLR